jgi:hypothetical protein
MRNISRTGPGGFPWAEGMPTRRQRLTVALLIAVVSAALHFRRALDNSGWSDFAPLWQAARLMFSGQSAYELMGPGNVVVSAYPMYYPATAFVIAGPFALIPSMHVASTVFVFVSALLLAYGITADGWYRLPVFPSIAYFHSVFLGQWSIVMMAALYLPVVAAIAVAKPQSALPVIGSATDVRAWKAAFVGGLGIVAISLIAMPSWPLEWWGKVQGSSDFVPAVARFGGPLILLNLLRWRRPEAWLILLAACMPQTWPPYNGLILMAAAMTYREACFLSLVSSIAWLAFAYFSPELTKAEQQSQMSIVLNLSGYIPATILILRRPNTGSGPLFLRWATRVTPNPPDGRP